jgi:hypothetical protein
MWARAPSFVRGATDLFGILGHPSVAMLLQVCFPGRTRRAGLDWTAEGAVPTWLVMAHCTSEGARAYISFG